MITVSVHTNGQLPDISSDRYTGGALGYLSFRVGDSDVDFHELSPEKAIKLGEEIIRVAREAIQAEQLRGRPHITLPPNTIS